jgi:HK97 family phage prohead protease
VEHNKPSGIERRYITASVANFITREDNGKTIVRGYAAVFNSMSEDLGGFKEKIAPGFFDKVLANDVRALFNHDSNLILGRTASGTCRIGVDANGLWFEYDDPQTSYSEDLQKSLIRGDVSQCSFAFSINYDSGDLWEKQPDGSYIRTLLICEQLYDVSPVTYPAYTGTSVGMRANDLAVAYRSLETIRQAETPPPPAYDFARSVERIRLSQLS